MPLESIKTNLKGGALSFSKIFPVAGKVIGAGITIRHVDKMFPRIPKKRRR